MLRDGRAITSAQALHRLRIQCKKLRYLLEFMAGLVPDDPWPWSHLKGLQDNLGEFNDLSVQRADTCAALDPDPPQQGPAGRGAALGGLLAALAARHGQVRAEFAAAFAAFDRREVAAPRLGLCATNSGRHP